MRHETILVLDFGGQYNQLIGRRVRDLSVYSEVHPYEKWRQKIDELKPRGIIFTGGPSSVCDENAPLLTPEIFELGIPILGICYGAQMTAKLLCGSVIRAEKAEYGRTDIRLGKSSLFKGIEEGIHPCFMSHGDRIESLPDSFKVTAESESSPIAAFEDESRSIYAVQFHPEVEHTPFGGKILKNFLYDICGCKGDWKAPALVDEFTGDIRRRVGSGKVLLALSGGVDSSVLAALLQRAVGRQLTCIFVDTGLMRKNEGDEVFNAFSGLDLNFIRVNAEDRFLNRLKGVIDPEKKRKIIGEEFIRVFEEEAKKIGAVDFLAQGTIYPDIIESGTNSAALIKSHHNVGGLPENIDFKEIIEPLRLLFKDEVRRLGLELGLSDKLVFRQPFPGPGLGIRVIGEVTKDRLDILREADAIFREEVSAFDTKNHINQYFVVMTDVRSVGVMGDGRTYDYMLALRAVSTIDFMTAEVAEIPWPILLNAARRIVAEVPNVNRIVYDITSKPPATIEWE